MGRDKDAESEKDAELGLEPAESTQRDNTGHDQAEATEKPDETHELDEDPRNPRNWSPGKKSLQLGVVAFLTLLSPLGSTIVAPGAEAILQHFHSDSETVGSFITSIYLLGYVFGPISTAPLSEHYGRLPVYHVSNVMFLVFNICCAVSPNIGAVLAFRFFAGTFGATAITLGPASIADLYVKEQRGLAFAAYAFGSLFGPVVGPVIGGFLVQAKGWRWVFWLLSILSGAAMVLAFVFLRETSLKEITQRESDKGRPLSREAEAPKRANIRELLYSMVRPLKMMVLYPVTSGLVLYSALIYGWLYLCFTTFPAVFQEQYGFSNAISGLVYLGFGVGLFVGIAASGATSDRIYSALGKRHGGSRPEHRLPILIVGGFFVPIALFWYGWSAEAKTQYMVPIVGTGLFGFGFVPIFMATSTYLVEAYPEFSASANAVSTIIRSLFGALLPLAGPSLYNSLGFGWGNSLLAFLTIAMLPISFILYRYGETLRAFKTWNGEL